MSKTRATAGPDTVLRDRLWSMCVWCQYPLGTVFGLRARGAATPWVKANLGAWWSGLACQGLVTDLYVAVTAVTC